MCSLIQITTKPLIAQIAKSLCLHPSILSRHPDSSTETLALWEKAASFLSTSNSCEKGGKTFLQQARKPCSGQSLCLYREIVVRDESRGVMTESSEILR